MIFLFISRVACCFRARVVRDQHRTETLFERKREKGNSERERINSTRVSKRKQSKTESHWCNHQSLKAGKERERDINT